MTTKLRGRESALAWVIFLPLAIAVNGIFLWGMRDVAFPRTPIGIAVDVLLLSSMYLLHRRWRRACLKDPRQATWGFTSRRTGR